MQAVVIATEREQQMGPLTDSMSVYGLPIGKASMVEGIVNKLFSIGVSEIALNIDNSGVKSLFGADRGIDTIEVDAGSITFSSSRESMTKGLDKDEPFLCVRGDMIYDTEGLEELAETETGFGYVGKSAGVRKQTQGAVTIEQGSVIDITAGSFEKRNTFSAYAFKFPPDAHEWDYDVDPMATELAHTRKPTAVEFSGWYPVQMPHQLMKAQTQDEPVVHEDADVQGSVTGTSYIGPDVTVEEYAVVKDSIVLKGSNIRFGAFVGSSVVGTWVDVDENVSTRHRNTQDRTITYELSGNRVDSGRKSFGSVIGPRTQVTAGSTLDVGDILDSGVVIR